MECDDSNWNSDAFCMLKTVQMLLTDPVSNVCKLSNYLTLIRCHMNICDKSDCHDIKHVPLLSYAVYLVLTVFLTIRFELLDWVYIL